MCYDLGHIVREGVVLGIESTDRYTQSGGPDRYGWSIGGCASGRGTLALGPGCQGSGVTVPLLCLVAVARWSLLYIGTRLLRCRGNSAVFCTVLLG